MFILHFVMPFALEVAKTTSCYIDCFLRTDFNQVQTFVSNVTNKLLSVCASFFKPGFQ